MRPELQEIADEASRVLGADVTIEDREFNLVAFGTQRVDIDAVRQASILRRQSTRQVRDWFEQFGIAESADPVRTPSDPAREIRSRLCVPARWRGVAYGYIWALDDNTHSLDSPAVLLVTQLAEHAAAYLAQFNRQRIDDALAVADLLTGGLDSARRSAAWIADHGLIARQVPVAAVVVGSWDGSTSAEETLIPNLWALPRMILTNSGPSSTALLVPLPAIDDMAFAHEAAALTLKLYEESLPRHWDGILVAGIGEPRADIVEVRASWLEARLAARVATAVPEVRPIARWTQLGVYRLLAAMSESNLSQVLLDAPIQKLLNDPNPGLATTVKTYLDRAGNVQDTANALNIHRQTLYSRLAKAERLTGLNFNSGRDRLWVHLGLILGPLLNNSMGDPHRSAD